jgi:hypothetical protein
LDDQRSNTGYAFGIGFTIVSWRSKKQPIVSLSSTEEEYKALCATTCEVVWLRKILQAVGEEQKKATVIKFDNQS